MCRTPRTVFWIPTGDTVVGKSVLFKAPGAEDAKIIYNKDDEKDKYKVLVPWLESININLPPGGSHTFDMVLW